MHIFYIPVTFAAQFLRRLLMAFPDNKRADLTRRRSDAMLTLKPFLQAFNTPF